MTHNYAIIIKYLSQKNVFAAFYIAYIIVFLHAAKQEVLREAPFLINCAQTANRLAKSDSDKSK